MEWFALRAIVGHHRTAGEGTLRTNLRDHIGAVVVRIRDDKAVRTSVRAVIVVLRRGQVEADGRATGLQGRYAPTGPSR